MDKLIALVTERAGISEDQAASAVNTVLGFVKDKLPDSISNNFDSIMEGEAGGGALDSLKGLAGKFMNK